jgi:hypothetical protein
MMFPTALRSLFIAAALALSVAIVWAMLAGGPLFAAVGRVAAEPWGAILLGDLYAGFLAATALFFLVERRGVALALFVALMILGNVVTLLWLAFRGWSALSDRLSSRA